MRAGSTLLFAPRRLRGLGAGSDPTFFGSGGGAPITPGEVGHVLGVDSGPATFFPTGGDPARPLPGVPSPNPLAPPTPPPTTPTTPAAPTVCATNWTTATDEIKAITDKFKACQGPTSVPDLLAACATGSDGGTGSYAGYLQARSDMFAAKANTSCPVASTLATAHPDWSYDAQSGLYYDPSSRAWYRCTATGCVQAPAPQYSSPVGYGGGGSSGGGGGGSYTYDPSAYSGQQQAPAVVPDTSPLWTRRTKVEAGIGGLVLLGGVVWLTMRRHKRSSRSSPRRSSRRHA